nr:hypothetical protein Iba_chr13dCG11150 [Ipomoea batatas]
MFRVGLFTPLVNSGFWRRMRLQRAMGISKGGCPSLSETHFDDKIGSIVNEFQLMKERSGCDDGSKSCLEFHGLRGNVIRILAGQIRMKLSITENTMTRVPNKNDNLLDVPLQFGGVLQMASFSVNF